jgi:heterodisulfide reductase subunit A
MPRIGVFVCHCGRNIAGTVDIDRLVEASSGFPDVNLSVDYKYMCSDPGQRLIHDAVKDHELDGVVIASCSPRLHEITFRNTCESAGLNPYKCEIANIREQCSWVHSDKEKGTEKALQTLETLVEKIRLNESLVPIEVPVTKRALVIGGGISGMEAALSIADSGHEVILVEREPVLGGNTARLSYTWLIQESSPCIVSSKVSDVYNHPRITLLTHSEIEEFSGYVGNFKASIRQKSTFIDDTKCDACTKCLEVCPVTVSAEEDRHFGPRPAVFIPDADTSPGPAVIDDKHCLHFTEGCSACADICPQKAVDFKLADRLVEEEFGAVIIATGFGPYDKKRLKDYGTVDLPDVVDGLEFEEMLADWERTNGDIKRPSDGKVPKDVVFVQCAGSRDKSKGVPYCSRICCMTTAKHAKLFRDAVPDGNAYIFYSHMRAGGKGFEEYVQEAVGEDGIIYLRGDIANIFPENGIVKVWGRDELSGQDVEIDADMVVLATPLVPSKGTEELAKKLKVATDENGFFAEIHPKLRPVESATRGVYLAGCAQSPRDIPESIAHALGAAGKVIALFSADVLYQEPIVVFVDEDICSGCGVCVEACPYGARRIDSWTGKAQVIAALCQGCGACAVACPSGATQQRNFTKTQIMKMIEAALKG